MAPRKHLTANTVAEEPRSGLKGRGVSKPRCNARYDHRPNSARTSASERACASTRSAAAAISSINACGSPPDGTTSADQRDNVPIVRIKRRLAVGGAKDLDLRQGIALEALDQDKVDCS